MTERGEGKRRKEIFMLIEMKPVELHFKKRTIFSLLCELMTVEKHFDWRNEIFTWKLIQANVFSLLEETFKYLVRSSYNSAESDTWDYLDMTRYSVNAHSIIFNLVPQILSIHAIEKQYRRRKERELFESNSPYALYKQCFFTFASLAF